MSTNSDLKMQTNLVLVHKYSGMQPSFTYFAQNCKLLIYEVIEFEINPSNTSNDMSKDLL